MGNRSAPRPQTAEASSSQTVSARPAAGTSEARLKVALRSPQAQAAFARGGEAAYLDYVTKHGRLEYELTNEAARTAHHDGPDAFRAYVRRVVAELFQPQQPERPFVVAPKEQRPLTPSARTKRPRTLASAFASSGKPPPAPPTGPPLQLLPPAPRIQPKPPDETKARIDLAAATNRYAQIVARQRQTHAGALLEGNQGWRAVQRIFSPILYRQAERDRAQAAQARAEYQARLDDYAAATAITAGGRAQVKLNAAQDFESQVIRLQAANTWPNAQQQTVHNWADKLRINAARIWLSEGKAGRIALVAVPAGVFGLGVGALSATVALPALAVGAAGLATVFGGRLIGEQIAITVNRSAVATTQGYEEITRWAGDRVMELVTQHSPHQRSRPPSDNFDVTELYENGTREAERRNAQRARLAQAIGATAAGLGFGLGHAAVSINSLQQAPTTSPHAPTPTVHGPPTPSTTPNTPPTPTVPPPPANLTHVYPWNAAAQWNTAHHLSTSPGSVWNTLHNAAAQWNLTHPGAHYRYVLHPNGTYWLQNGAQQLTSWQMGNFNTFLWNLGA